MWHFLGSREAQVRQQDQEQRPPELAIRVHSHDTHGMGQAVLIHSFTHSIFVRERVLVKEVNGTYQDGCPILEIPEGWWGKLSHKNSR